MGQGRYLVDAVLLEGRRPAELATSHGIARSWIYELIRRFHAGGYAALEPASRRPKSCSHAVTAEVQEAILRLRHGLLEQGLDAGPHTIAHHLRLERDTSPSTASIWRILRRHGAVVEQPQKRPRSSLHCFTAELPNQLWQADTTHWHLADGSDVEILNCVDDHSRLLVVSDAFRTVKAADVVRSFAIAWQAQGYPAALLTDNGAVFSGKSRHGKVLLESELERLGIQGKHSRPYHPQTCGKVERLHQTLKRYLSKQVAPASLAVLQAQLDAFRAYYNQQRPHRSLHGLTPLHAYHARVKAYPTPGVIVRHYRVRHDRVDKSGRVTLRYLSRLHHIGLGAAYKHQRVTLLIANRDIRVVTAEGELIRSLTLDPSRDYQPLGTPSGPPRIVRDVVRHVSAMS